MSETKNDFSRGNVFKLIISLAVPLIFAQLVQVAYNIVDRIYIGHLPGSESTALTGLGLTFPIVTIIMAFTSLFGMGGAPLCSIERGKGDNERASLIMGNTLTMLLITSVLLMALCYPIMKPMLYLFGASDDTYAYASAYLKIYLLGTPFTMIGTGMNGFINCQGFAKTGMVTTLVGAVTNIILDPVFIFVFHLGVEGAAIATVIAQFLSAVWVMKFLLGKKTLLKLSFKKLVVVPKLLLKILGLGMAGFIMSASTGLVQIVCNSTLKTTGGDIYVGAMTVLNSLREIMLLPASGMTNAAQPVIGFNYGAKKYGRIKKSILFISITSVIYMTVCEVFLMLFPKFFIGIFNSDPLLLDVGVPALKIYFLGWCFLSLQLAGQSVFVGMGLSKHAVTFSILRKVIIVVPLTLILPHMFGLGVNGVFYAELISNIVGGCACFFVMLFTVSKIFTKAIKEASE